MTTDAPIAQVDELLEPWKACIGKDYTAYRNHVCRMVTFCCDLHPCTAEERQKIAIAGAFHDIGIWTENTLDYLEPSVAPARDSLQQLGRSDWLPEIAEMITEHHRLRPIRDSRFALVELFRRGDLVDFSLGLVRQGLPRQRIREVQQQYPNAGFHKRLVQLAGSWFLRHPLNPAPMMKW